jgi:hypothetical protein
MREKKLTLALTAGFDRKKRIYSLLKSLKDIGIDSYAVLLGEGWETAAEELLKRLKRASHIVIIPETLRDTWFPFLAGYSSGRESSGYCLLEEPAPSHSSLYNVLKTFTSAEQLCDFFIHEKDLWEKKEREKNARSELVESGLGLTNENFAACVVQGKREAINNYLDLGFSPDTENERGVPLLILAIRNKHGEIALDLISRGADVNRISVDRGNTALIDAASAEELPLVLALLEGGADIDKQSKSGQTALMLAAGEGKILSVKELLRRGADTAIKDNLGMTAKKYAELFKHSAVIELLTEAQEEKKNGPK